MASSSTPLSLYGLFQSSLYPPSTPQPPHPARLSNLISVDTLKAALQTLDCIERLASSSNDNNINNNNHNNNNNQENEITLTIKQSLKLYAIKLILSQKEPPTPPSLTSISCLLTCTKLPPSHDIFKVFLKLLPSSLTTSENSKTLQKLSNEISGQTSLQRSTSISTQILLTPISSISPLLFKTLISILKKGLAGEERKVFESCTGKVFKAVQKLIEGGGVLGEEDGGLIKGGVFEGGNLR